MSSWPSSASRSARSFARVRGETILAILSSSPSAAAEITDRRGRDNNSRCTSMVCLECDQTLGTRQLALHRCQLAHRGDLEEQGPRLAGRQRGCARLGIGGQIEPPRAGRRNTGIAGARIPDLDERQATIDLQHVGVKTVKPAIVLLTVEVLDRHVLVGIAIRDRWASLVDGLAEQ